MGICSWIIFGFFAGLLGRAILPGEQKMGFIKTTVLGVLGAFVGGFLSSFFTGRDPFAFRPAGFIGAVLGAIVLLVLGGLLGGNRRR